MKRILLAVVVVALVAGRMAMGQVRTGAAEPEGVQLLRIDMRKALTEADAAPKMTQVRAAKMKILQGQMGQGPPSKELADAEVDLLEAQATEQTTGLNAKIVETQLKEAIKNAASAPPRQAASAAEVTVLQMELQKAKIQADTASRTAENRRRYLAQLQAGPEAGRNPLAIVDAQADVVAAETNAALLALETESAQVRLDVATKSVTPGK